MRAKRRHVEKARQPGSQVKAVAWPIVTLRDDGPHQPPPVERPTDRERDRYGGANGGPHGPGNGRRNGGPHRQPNGGHRVPDGHDGHDRPRDREPDNGSRRGQVPPPPATCSGRLYRVREGDTIFRLAIANGVTTEAILAANPQITNPDVLLEGQVICIPGRVERATDILNILLTAEKLETAMYARGLESPALQSLPPDERAYFQAGLSHEIAHIDILTELGASVPYEEFFFPPGTFDDLNLYVNTLLTLETAGISAYIQASYEFARMGELELSRLMDQIMGVEAEHRALLRDVIELVPANNLCFERAPNQPVAQILSALPSFLEPNQFNGSSVGPVPLPTAEQAERLIGPYGCPNPRPSL